MHTSNMAKMTNEHVITVQQININMHSSNRVSGIKMSSNGNDAMRRNEVLVETNNLTYYTHEMEQYTWSYDALNMA